MLLACSALANEEISRIAHADGGFKNWQYTNSLEALDFNLDYFDLFEIDFVWTTDEKLVCLHDWRLTAEWIFQRSFSGPVSKTHFQELVANNPYVKSCTLTTLVEWLEIHPGKRVVTDIKRDNLRGLRRISKQLGDNAADRVVVQIYTPDEYARVKELGYKDIIWTLYRYKGDEADILRITREMELYAVALPRELAKTGIAMKLKEQGVPAYVYTVNTQREVALFHALGVDEIYTDWLVNDSVSTEVE